MNKRKVCRALYKVIQRKSKWAAFSNKEVPGHGIRQKVSRMKETKEPKMPLAADKA